MTILLAVLALISLFLSFFSPPGSVTFGAGAVVFIVMARMSQAQGQQDKLLEALGYERPTRKQEFEAAREEMADVE